MCKFYLIILGLTLSSGVTNSQYRKPASNNNNEDNSYQDIFSSQLGQDFPQEYDKFDWDILQKLNTPKSENVLISPWSIKYAISMLYEAAQGQTRAEIQHVLNTALNSTENTAKMVAIREYLKTPATMEYILEFGNRMFIDGSINPEQRYSAILEDSYKTKLTKIDVNKPKQTADEANNWVKEVTKGNIERIVSEDDLRDTVILLINTLYFNGTWEYQFQVNDTTRAPFYLSGSKSVVVPMMSQTEKFYYYNSKNLEAKLLKLPYKGEKLSMVIILPNSIQGLSDLVTRFTAGMLQREISRMTLENVAVTVPKFKFEFEAHLVPILKSMGLREVFENTASLPGLARGKGLQTKLAVNDVLQKSGIELNEIGSTVYAATAITLVNKFGEDDDGLEEFMADKPFIFFIQNDETKQILFIGTVDDPTKIKGTIAEQKLPVVPVPVPVAAPSEHKYSSADPPFEYDKTPSNYPPNNRAIKFPGDQNLFIHPTGFKYGKHNNN